MTKIFYINLIYFKAAFKMHSISQGNRLHPAPVLTPRLQQRFVLMDAP